MDLLPKSRQEFQDKDFWNSFFSKRQKSFEWYGEYTELCGYIHKYIKPADTILNVGCGNSKICMDLYDVGYKNITNIDTSAVVIRQMTTQNKKDRADMKFIKADATNMKEFQSGQFSVVFDKGTLDALLVDETKDTIKLVQSYWLEIDRVLRKGGRYVIVSLLQEHILKALLARFPPNNWMFRVVRCLEAENKIDAEQTENIQMPVFMIVATKLEKLPMTVLEICTVGDKIVRVKTPEEIIHEVDILQKAAITMNGMKRTNLSESGEVDFFFFTSIENPVPRYRTFTLDQPPKREYDPYAAFLIPQGRESEWSFGTPAGRKQFFLEHLNYNRITFIMLSRECTYTTWKDISVELTEALGRFAPGNATSKKFPFLTMGNDVGKREIIYKGKSDLSGEFIVEDVLGADDETFRRLIFLNNQFVIQSEAQLILEKLKNGTIKKLINPYYLACEHHRYMTVGVNAIRSLSKMKSKKNISCLIIGLGGGGLPTHIHRVTNNINVTVIEIDPAIAAIAKDYFDLKEDPRLTVVIDDGLAYLKKAVEEGKLFKSILFDVDSKDSTIGMSCPPTEFVSHEMLETVKKCLVTNGIFVLNMVCRDETLRAKVKEDLKAVFSTIHSYKMGEDINEVLFCMNMEVSASAWSDAMEASAKRTYAKTGTDTADNMVDLNELLEKLKIK